MLPQPTLESILKELVEESEETRTIHIYAICAAMAEAGLLEYLGVSEVSSDGTLLLFRNPDTDRIVEVCKPLISAEDDQAIKEHIRNLLYPSSC